MSILKIAKIGHPILSIKAKLVDKIPDSSLNNLVKDMSETMLEAEGVGLAAPQIHISKQIMIFRIPDNNELENDTIEVTALINPKIIISNEKTENQWEGCLSIPGMTGLVKRYSEIEYEGLDLNGKIIKKKVSGLHARIVQHEFDHLNGVMYTQRLVDPRAFGFAEEINKYWKDKNEKN